MRTYTVTVTLEATISFLSDIYYVTEGDEVEVTVELSSASLRDAPITFPLAKFDEGASPDDYSVPESITVGANETSASFTITATQDTGAEGDERFTILLEQPTQGENVIYEDPAFTTIHIIDDDSPGMAILPRTLDVDEGGTANYTVNLNTAPTGDVTVEIFSDDPGRRRCPRRR